MGKYFCNLHTYKIMLYIIYFELKNFNFNFNKLNNNSSNDQIIKILKYLFFQFYGVYKFRYPLYELQQLVPTLEGTEVTITATVGDRYLNEIVNGYSTARFFNSSVKVAFLGGSPQVFKPAMPFTVYVSIIIFYILMLFIFINFV